MAETSQHPTKALSNAGSDSQTQPQNLNVWLNDFFHQWKLCRPNLLEEKEDELLINSAMLAHFLDELERPLAVAYQNALFFDPWEVAGLGRKEVQNTSVLAWLLNPEGNHNLGPLAFNALLKILRSHTTISDYGRYCRVEVERSPYGQENRVDIEIDAENIYLLIEAKIDAAEQQDQLVRYCEDAKRRAGKRRDWVVIFLTPDGRAATTAGKLAKHVCPISWRQLANSIERELQPHFQKTMATTSPTRHMADLSIRCFLNRMYQF